MPKKAPRNAFYFFMVDFREEQRKKGINYGKMNEVADAAGPLWKEAAPAIRQKYEAIAKKEKQKNNIPELKYTSTGVPLSEIERQQREQQQAEEAERKDIKNLVKLKSFNGAIVNEDFYIMDVNYYCKVHSEHLIGESTILRFNLRDGIRETYHEMINPGYIPVGYASDVKQGSLELGLEVPDESGKRSNYMQILANIIDYLKQKDKNATVLPPIFTMPDKVMAVQDFIQQMCYRAGEDDSLFRVYRLDTLFFTLINAIKTRDDEGLPKESLALQQLKKDLFKYTPGIGCTVLTGMTPIRGVAVTGEPLVPTEHAQMCGMCLLVTQIVLALLAVIKHQSEKKPEEHHEESDKTIECTSSRVKRLAYTILDSCCPIVGVELEPGKHLPFDYDMDSILTYRDQKKERQAPTVACSMVHTCNSSMISESFNDSLTLNSASDSVKKVKRAPRMPKTDYSHNIRPAPELTDTDFPKLTAGVGRGRGLGGSIGRLRPNN